MLASIRRLLVPAVASAVLLASGCSVLYGTAFTVTTDVMAPLAQKGSTIYWRPGARPNRGDVIFYTLPNDPANSTIGRVVALPGETVAISGGKVLVNGQPIDDSKANGPTGDLASSKVPDESFFVLGDNRATKQDSRTFGPVDRMLLQGIVSHPK